MEGPIRRSTFASSMLPNSAGYCREYIHKPRFTTRPPWRQLPMYLEIKQVLCQPGRPSGNFEKKPSKTNNYRVHVSVYRDGHMSSRCRWLGTTATGGGANTLITDGCRHVVDVRQAQTAASLPNNNGTEPGMFLRQRLLAIGITTRLRRRRGTYSRNRTCNTDETGSRNTFNFVYCLPFSTLHRKLCVLILRHGL